ncbi:MAG: transglutaminase domain-containing protein [Eubacterium sp.]|nr:transglutaminase domain-containing protein [Eubacterium sp.]
MSDMGTSAVFRRSGYKRIIAVTLIMAFFCGMFCGCETASAQITIETTEATGAQVEQNDNCIIDYSGAANGYINVRYTESTDKTIKAQVAGPTGVTYTYTIRKDKYEVIPLTEGNGAYKVTVLKNVSGNSYAVVLAASFSVSLQNEFQPYIRPNQYVDFTASTKCVKKAESLCKKANTDLKKVKKVYNWVIKYFKYDYDKAKTVKAGYLPVLDTVYGKKKGICFDYAATMTAMLRSQGVPVKLVIGYTGEEYHAWINVYSRKKGWITGAIYIASDKWKLMDPTFASTGGSSKTVMKYINNTKNYKAKYSY